MRAIHYLGLSLAAHAGLALLFLLLRAPQPARAEEIRVVLELGPADSPVRGETGAPQETAPLRAAASPSFPGGGDIPAPLPETSGTAVRAGTSGRTASAQLRLPAPPSGEAEIILPAAETMLDLVRSRAVGVQPPAAGTASPGQETELVWSGGGRRLLKQGDLSFPELLIREGQELDVEARFLVSPAGRVTEIEITRSSGYILVDRAVERALLEYLFEGSATGEIETGLIRFRFRLERMD